MSLQSSSKKRKVQEDPEMDVFFQWLEGKIEELPNDLPSRSKPKSFNLSYNQEISKMLHAFGDVSQPLPSTIVKIEEIAQQFLKKLFNKINEYIKIKKIKRISLNILCKIFSDEPKLLAKMEKTIAFLRAQKHVEKDLGLCFEDKDLTEINSNSDLNACTTISLDELKVDQEERLEKYNKKTEGMEVSQYLYFAHCRTISFTRPKRKKKFIQWIKPFHLPIKLNPEMIEIIGDLLYAHLEEIVWNSIEKNQLSGPLQPEHIDHFLQN